MHNRGGYIMARFYYSDVQKERIRSLLNLDVHADKYITTEAIKKFTKDFNEFYGTDQKFTAIAAQLRIIKTEIKSPVKIEWHLKRDRIRVGRFPTVLLDKTTREAVIGSPCQKVKHLIKALNDCVAELVEEDVSLKTQMRKMAGIKAAVEQYQKMG
jgi:hypothetical protein